VRSEVIIRDGRTDRRPARTVRLTGLRKAAARRLVESGCSVRRAPRIRGKLRKHGSKSHSGALLKHMVKRCGPQTQDGARLCVTTRDISAMDLFVPKPANHAALIASGSTYAQLTPPMVLVTVGILPGG
jgi:hypothetical protein